MELLFGLMVEPHPPNPYTRSCTLHLTLQHLLERIISRHLLLVLHLSTLFPTLAAAELSLIKPPAVSLFHPRRITQGTEQTIYRLLSPLLLLCTGIMGFLEWLLQVAALPPKLFLLEATGVLFLLHNFEASGDPCRLLMIHLEHSRF